MIKGNIIKFTILSDNKERYFKIDSDKLHTAELLPCDKESLPYEKHLFFIPSKYKKSSLEEYYNDYPEHRI